MSSEDWCKRSKHSRHPRHFFIWLLYDNLNAEKNLDKGLKLRRKNRFSSRGYLEKEKGKSGDKKKVKEKRKKVKQMGRRGRLLPSL